MTPQEFYTIIFEDAEEAKMLSDEFLKASGPRDDNRRIFQGKNLAFCEVLLAMKDYMGITDERPLPTDFNLTESLVFSGPVYCLPHKPKEVEVWQGAGYYRVKTWVVEPSMKRTRKPDLFSTVYPAKKWVSEKEFFTPNPNELCLK